MACRICLEESGTFISPCNCKGTTGKVHTSCLQTWILESRSDRCEICKHEYSFKEYSVYKFKYYLEALRTLKIPTEIWLFVYITAVLIAVVTILLTLSVETRDLVWVHLYVVISMFIISALLNLRFNNVDYDVPNVYMQNIVLVYYIFFAPVFFGIIDTRKVSVQYQLDGCKTCKTIEDNCDWACEFSYQWENELEELNKNIYNMLYSVGIVLAFKLILDSLNGYKYVHVPISLEV